MNTQKRLVSYIQISVLQEKKDIDNIAASISAMMPKMIARNKATHAEIRKYENSSKLFTSGNNFLATASVSNKNDEERVIIRRIVPYHSLLLSSKSLSNLSKTFSLAWRRSIFNYTK